MKAYFYGLERFSSFDFGESEILAVETVQPRFFRGVVRNLKGLATEPEEVAFYEKDRLLLTEKDYFLLLDYFDTEVLSKTVNGKVLKALSAEVNGDPARLAEFRALLSAMYGFVLRQLEEEEIVFDSDGERSFEEVLKLFSVAVTQSRSDVFGKMLNLIEVAGRLRLVRFLALVNAKSFFEEKELAELCKMARYRGLSLFFIDNFLTGKKIADETLLVVEEDFFERIS